MQANLINIHVPRGKGRVTAKRLRPKRTVAGIFAWAKSVMRRQEGGVSSEPLPPLPPVKRGDKEGARKMLRERRAEMAAREEAIANQEFWDKAEGRKVEEALSGRDDFWETDEGRRMRAELDEYEAEE